MLPGDVQHIDIEDRKRERQGESEHTPQSTIAKEAGEL